MLNTTEETSEERWDPESASIQLLLTRLYTAISTKDPYRAEYDRIRPISRVVNDAPLPHIENIFLIVTEVSSESIFVFHCI
jgi:hypothetical protein